MNEKFMFYENFLDALDMLPEGEREKACYEFCKYGITGQLPNDRTIAMFCIGVSASVRKYEGRGGTRQGAGRKPKQSETSDNSEESKDSEESKQEQKYIELNDSEKSKKSKESKNSKKSENSENSYATNINKNINSKKDNNNIIIQRKFFENFENCFEEFWSLYTPVRSSDGRVVSKGSKEESKKKFIKILNEGESYANIIKGLRNYIEFCRANNQLTCGVTVFLNQKRWLDDYHCETVNAEQPSTKRQEVNSVLEPYAELINQCAN